MSITKQDLYKRIDSLPEALQEVVFSGETLDILHNVADAHHLNDDRFSKLAATMTFLIAGFIHPEDLVKELIDGLRVEKRIAEELAKEVRVKLLHPIADELAQAHGFHIEGAPAPVQPQGSQLMQSTMDSPSASMNAEPIVPSSMSAPKPPQEVILKPHVQKEGLPAGPLASPFVLHEHRSAEANREEFLHEASLTRPSFFHAPESLGTNAEEYAEPAPAARLELGRQTELGGAYVEPKTTRVGQEEAKIVHYSAPDVQADPFSRTPEPPATNMPQPTPKPAPPPAKPSVHPDNVVNLKDLPK